MLDLRNGMICHMVGVTMLIGLLPCPSEHSLSALQLHALGFISQPKLDTESGVAGTLMDMYQDMGDVLALQYGGSAAHNMVREPSRSNPPRKVDQTLCKL
jgi:hypothetical protein